MWMWTWIKNHAGLVIVVLFALVTLTVLFSNINGCSTSATAAADPTNFWKFLLVGLVIAGVISYRINPDRLSFPLACLGGAGLCFLVVLGKFDFLFTLASIGLPLFAAAGFYGAYKTEGRIRAFLGLASGIVTSLWLILLLSAHCPVTVRNFVKTFFPGGLNYTAGKIFVVAFAVFCFATWKRSWVFYLISFAVFLSFLGNVNVNQMLDRFPDRLTPSISDKTKSTWERIWDTLLQRAEEAVKPGPILPPSTLPPASSPPLPAASATSPKKTVVEAASKFPLRFAGSKEIGQMGHADFEIDFPYREGKGVRYQVVLQVACESDAKFFLRIDDSSEFIDSRPDPDHPDTVVFFGKVPGGKQGYPSMFHAGNVRFHIWADRDVRIIDAHLEQIFPSPTA